jgi:hypothetical protein
MSTPKTPPPSATDALPTWQPQAAAAGPIQQATLIVHDAAPVLSAYANLGLGALRHGAVSVEQAHAWGQPELADCDVVELGTTPNERGLLRLIEVPGTPPRPTRFSHGWLALEILVRDVDALAKLLPDHGFEVVGPPADLDVSPHIRAMQVVGPAGEMLYLTQVRAPVPPFDIPVSPHWFDGRPFDQHIGPLFIAVMSTPSRANTLLACTALAPKQSLQFDTKITVLNRALGRTVDSRWPVATTQWAGGCLFEIDEVQDPGLQAPATVGALPAGLAWISMQAPSNAPPARLFEVSPGAWLELLPAP